MHGDMNDLLKSEAVEAIDEVRFFYFLLIFLNYFEMRPDIELTVYPASFSDRVSFARCIMI